MKKIVDRLLYDTADAICIAHSNSHDFDLFGINCEISKTKLYMTKSSRYFFYVKSLETSWFSMYEKEDIKPVSEEDAKNFCLKHNAYNFEQIWGDKIERA